MSVSICHSKTKRASLLVLGLLAISQLQGCLMAGNPPSGGDVRLLYAGSLALALVAVLWLVIRFMK
jgi:hypothetical protein